MRPLLLLSCPVKNSLEALGMNPRLGSGSVGITERFLHLHRERAWTAKARETRQLE